METTAPPQFIQCLVPESCQTCFFGTEYSLSIAFLTSTSLYIFFVLHVKTRNQTKSHDSDHELSRETTNINHRIASGFVETETCMQGSILLPITLSAERDVKAPRNMHGNIPNPATHTTYRNSKAEKKKNKILISEIKALVTKRECTSSLARKLPRKFPSMITKSCNHSVYTYQSCVSKWSCHNW